MSRLAAQQTELLRAVRAPERGRGTGRVRGLRDGLPDDPRKARTVRRANGIGYQADWLRGARKHELPDGLSMVVAAPTTSSLEAASRGKHGAALRQMCKDFLDAGVRWTSLTVPEVGTRVLASLLGLRGLFSTRVMPSDCPRAGSITGAARRLAPLSAFAPEGRAECRRRPESPCGAAGRDKDQRNQGE